MLIFYHTTRHGHIVKVRAFSNEILLNSVDSNGEEIETQLNLDETHKLMEALRVAWQAVRDTQRLTEED